MRAIFISYRRDDSEGQAGRLFKDLAERFGNDSVFMDVVDIEPGRDFRRVIDQQVASCGVLLAMIGKEWIDARDESGRRRLDDANDFVRLETATALKRDIPVIPVLVQGARMPRADQLPTDLQDLAYRNAVELTHARWNSDVEVLVNSLRQQLGVGKPAAAAAAPPATAPGDAGIAATSGPRVAEPLAASPASKGGRAALVAGTVGILLFAAGGYLAFDRTQRLAAEKAAAEIAATRAQVEKAAAEAAAEKASAQAAVEKVQAEATAAKSAAKSAAEQAARKAEADRLRTESRAQADKAVAVAAERAAVQAAIEKTQADATAAKLAAEEAARRAEAEKLRREQTAADDGSEHKKSAKHSPTSAAVQSASYDGSITVTDPCTNRTLTARGTIRLTIRTTAEGIVVQDQFRGSVDAYVAMYQGTATFQQPAPTYDVPISGEWRVDGRVAFSSRGMDHIYANPAGIPTGDKMTLSNNCPR